MTEPKKIVARGYNSITQSYLQLIESMGPLVREKYLNVISESLPPGARILELGCGAGVPMTKGLAGQFRVVGIDISIEQLKLAKENVPEADFILADMAGLTFPEATFDAVVAFYSITHLPRDEHHDLLANIYRMLKPDGLLVAAMGSRDNQDTIESDWLGAPMFFSHFDGRTNEELINEAGFKIISAEDEWEKEFGRPVCFSWFVARKAS